ncbi:hypothetical protein TB2_007092 [Malus domestica]
MLWPAQRTTDFGGASHIEHEPCSTGSRSADLVRPPRTYLIATLWTPNLAVSNQLIIKLAHLSNSFRFPARATLHVNLLTYLFIDSQSSDLLWRSTSRVQRFPLFWRK